jgi:hypothetical protein
LYGADSCSSPSANPGDAWPKGQAVSVNISHDFTGAQIEAIKLAFENWESAGLLAQETKVQTASPAVTASGIATYDVTTYTDGSVVRLMGPGGLRVGMYRAKTIGLSRMEELTYGGHTLRITMTDAPGNDPTGSAMVKVDNRSFMANFNGQSWEIEGMTEEDAHALLRTHGNKINLMTQIKKDLEIKLKGPGHIARDGALLEPPDAKAACRAVGGPTPKSQDTCTVCSNSWACRGTAKRAARSEACEIAKDDANFCCWNSCSTGCCAFLGCDSACVFGDFVCHAGITGSWIIEPN